MHMAATAYVSLCVSNGEYLRLWLVYLFLYQVSTHLNILTGSRFCQNF